MEERSFSTGEYSIATVQKGVLERRNKGRLLSTVVISRYHSLTGGLQVKRSKRVMACFRQLRVAPTGIAVIPVHRVERIACNINSCNPTKPRKMARCQTRRSRITH
jgi:hypothetical protein